MNHFKIKNYSVRTRPSHERLESHLDSVQAVTRLLLHVHVASVVLPILVHSSTTLYEEFLKRKIKKGIFNISVLSKTLLMVTF